MFETATARNRIWVAARLFAEASDGLGCDTAEWSLSFQFGVPVRAYDGESGLAVWQLRKVLQHMSKRMPGRVSLRELAGLANLSPSYFNRAFKQSVGVTPYQWQLRARIEGAQEKLLSSDFSLEDIAAATGFGDAVHFGRRFKQIVGVAPAHWRRSHRV